MKKSYLQQIIREEIQNALNESIQKKSLGEGNLINPEAKSNPRTREYVFNKVMFSRFAFNCGYSQVALGKFLKLDRTTIIYYINDYKDRNYAYQESDTETIG